MGNSEVGHLNIGAGRVVYQDLTRISKAIDDGSFFENRVLVQAFDKAAGRGSTVHLMGLVSDGGVHTDLGHLRGVPRPGPRRSVRDVVVHAFLDGRDTPPRSAPRYLAEVEDHGRLRRGPLRHGRAGATTPWTATLAGTASSWPTTPWSTATAGSRAARRRPSRSPTSAARTTSSCGRRSSATIRRARVKDGDVCIFFNFRPDRARQLTRAFFDRGFARFDRGHTLRSSTSSR